MHLPRSLLCALPFSFFVFTAASLADEQTVEINLTGTTFTPSEIKVPKDTGFVIRFTNGNSKLAELESKELKIEKAAGGHSTIVVRVKPAAPGKYLFVDEYQEDVAKGYITVE